MDQGLESQVDATTCSAPPRPDEPRRRQNVQLPSMALPMSACPGQPASIRAVQSGLIGTKVLPVLRVAQPHVVLHVFGW